MEHDGRHADRRTRCEAALDIFNGRIAGCESEAMSIRVHDHVDEVRVVERLRGARVRRLVELPVRRPHAPEQLAQLIAIFLDAGAAALAVHVVLVPPEKLAIRRLRLRRRGDVLDGVAAAQHHADDALGPKRRDDAARTPAPIEAAEQRAFDGERVHQVDQVLREYGLLSRTRCVRRPESRRAVAAQIRDDHTAALRRQDGGDFIVRMHVVWTAVQQDHRRAARRAALLISHLQDARFNLLRHASGGMGRPSRMRLEKSSVSEVCCARALMWLIAFSSSSGRLRSSSPRR